MSWILAADYDATNDLDQIDVLTLCGAGDLDCDGIGDVVDLLALLAAWGPCT